MNIAASSAVNAAAKVRAAVPVHKSIPAGPAQAPATAEKTDRAELSNTGELQRLVQLAKGGDIRADKVAAIKAQINAGTYDVAGKAALVAARLLADLGL